MTAPLNRRRGWYSVGDRQYPSVTSVLNKVLAKPALVPWASELVAVAAVTDHHWRTMESEAAIDYLKGTPRRVQQRALDRGSLVHLLCELLQRDIAPHPELMTSEVEPYVRAFRAWIEDFDVSFLLTEATVYHDTAGNGLGYAGQLDFVAELRGASRVLVDIKTGKAVYPEHSLQATAYRWAEHVVSDKGTEAPVPEVDETYILLLKPDDYEFVPVRSDSSIRDAWESCLNLFQWINRRDLIGQAVSAGRLL